jgi:cephalosporin-C deacetylase-like acetyl esterase
MIELRNNIAEIIGIKESDVFNKVEYNIIESKKEDGYERQLIEYNSYDNKVVAYLLIPEVIGKNPAILINHQHNSERHLGKSEVCGLAGNPLQAFGPVLAQKGFVVLAPDSICFEERRKKGHGITPLPNDDDFLQHYNEMCYRIIKGENLMKKVLLDAMNSISLLNNLEIVENGNIGTLGHSYGGNTALFLTALDERIKYTCASGSGCTYKNRMMNNVGIEMASVIPNFIIKYDIQDLVRCIAPRHLLIVSAEDDKYSKDADVVVEQAVSSYSEYQSTGNLYHKR